MYSSIHFAQNLSHLLEKKTPFCLRKMALRQGWDVTGHIYSIPVIHVLDIVKLLEYFHICFQN